MQSSNLGGEQIGGQPPRQSATEFNKHFGPMRKSQVAHCKRDKKPNKKKEKNNENIQATSKKVNGKVFVMNAGASQTGETTPHFTLRLQLAEDAHYLVY